MKPKIHSPFMVAHYTPQASSTYVTIRCPIYIQLELSLVSWFPLDIQVMHKLDSSIFGHNNFCVLNCLATDIVIA